VSRLGWVNVALLAGVAGVAVAGVTAVGNPTKAQTTVRTARVQRGAVLATVTATGNVASLDSLALNFSTSGRVAEVDVHPGDQVVAGQVLARLDDRSTKGALAAAQANLTAAQARLEQALHPLSAAQAAANQAAVDQATLAVANAQTSLNDLLKIVAANAAGYQANVDSAQAQLDADKAQRDRDQQKLQQDQSSGADSATIQADQNKVDSDNQAVEKDQANLDNAKTAQQQGLARDQQSVDAAKASVASAQQSLQTTLANNALKSAPPLPGDLASDRAAVTSAQAALATAQQNDDGTALTAPVAGTIGAVNGVVGQLASAGGTSATTGTTTASGSSGSAGSGSSSSAASSTGFISLIDLNGLEVKAGFSETDASRVKNGQPATVTFNALPGEQVAGHVVAVDNLATVVSNVVTYNVTVALDNAAGDVKPGMSASVAVFVGRADNVLHVPTAAVRGTGTTGTVTVVRNGAQVQVPVTVGLRGDDAVEIDSGLNAGDEVVVSTATSGATGSRTGATPGAGFGRGFGGGGGGFGGGGGGLRGGGG
jgi:multidrug efflux pump subunit AcrA (membrane-fusion protein)